MPIMKGHCACDMLHQTFNISKLKCGENNSTTIKHIYNKSASLIDSCDVVFVTNDW